MPLGTFTPTTTATRGATPKNLARGDVATSVREGVLALANYASTNAPRNLQRKIGPSEVGHPCARNVAHKLAGTPVQRNPSLDPWPSIVGTAVHAWLAEAIDTTNDRLAELGHPKRWLAEQRVEVAPGVLAGAGTEAHLTGSCDCYDIWLRTVVDFKVLGNTQHGEYLTGYVSDQYRAQIHLYALGLHRLGYPVEHVSLAIFGRAKRLTDLYVWSEPWNQSFAEATLSRLVNIQTVVSAGIDPMTIKAIPSRNGCYFCPWRPSCPEAQAQAK